MPEDPVERDSIVYTERTEYDDLGDLLEATRTRAGVPAIVAGVVRSDGVHALGAAGVRSLAAPEPATIDDPFHLGSVTKSMTATLAALMVQRGAIAWDTPLFRARAMLRDEISPEWGTVTLEEFLSHRSGLPEDRVPDQIQANLFQLGGLMWKQRLGVCEAIFADPPPMLPNGGAGLEPAELEAVPVADRRFRYSNRGYVAAAAMLEGVTAREWESLLRTELLEPLGLKSAGFGPPGAEPIPASGIVPPLPSESRDPGTPITAMVPWGHVVDPDSPENGYQPVEPHALADNPAWMRPAGGVHMSVRDLARYAMFHLRGARGVKSPPFLLGDAEFQKLHTDARRPAESPGDSQSPKQGYAMGWAVSPSPIGPGTVLAHDGSNGRFYAVVWIAPEADVAIVCATNAGDEAAQRACADAIGQLVTRYAIGAD